MKRIALFLTAMAMSVTAYSQGTLVFANGATSLITTNSLAGQTGNIQGAGQYRFALYIGAAGSTSNQLVIIAPSTTNGPIAGRFSGGSAYVLPSGYPGGDQAGAVPITLQVRAWSAVAGSTYEQALESALPGVYAGASQMATLTPGGGLVAAAAIFGTSPLLGGFELRPVPEPSTIALGLLGLLGVYFIRRRK